MNKNILKLAIPNIISNISIPLLTLVDLAVLGHLESEVYIGAIALGGTIFNFIYWGFAFLRMGTSGLSAQAYGRRHFREAANILIRAIVVGVVGSLIIIILQKGIALLSFSIIEGSTEVERLAKEYFYIRIWAAPASLSLFALSGWFIGMQNSRIPMVISLFVNILNLGFNLFFIYILGMKSDGVALGTLISQYLGLILALGFVYRYYRRIFANMKMHIVLNWRALKIFFQFNSDIFVRMVCITLVFTFFNVKSAAFDDTILAINTLLLQFFMFFSYLADGFAYASEALTGRYIGEKNQQKLNKSVRYIFKWGMGTGLFFTLIYAVAGNNIVGILTDNVRLINAIAPYMIWVTFVPLLSFAAFIWDGIYIGATASRLMRNTMLISTVGLFFPMYYLTTSLGNHGLWLALITFMLGRGILQTIYSPKVIKIPL